MIDRTHLDRRFADALGADLGQLAPGEIRVVRCESREDATVTKELPQSLLTPVWILVAQGRGIVSSSRFLLKVVEDWAASFAAPEHLLDSRFLNELVVAVGKACDGEVVVLRHRIPLPGRQNRQRDYGRLIRLLVIR